jgi:hypothetical protein
MSYRPEVVDLNARGIDIASSLKARGHNQSDQLFIDLAEFIEQLLECLVDDEEK